MVEKIKRLISSEQIPTVNSGLQLLDSLQEQSLYEKLLQGWCIKNGRLSHPEKPFSAFVAWHLWMHAPNEISTLQITETLRFSMPHIAHLPHKGWQRLAKLKILKLPPESVFRHFPAAMSQMRSLQKLEWQIGTSHPPTELLKQLSTIVLLHDNHSVEYATNESQMVIYKEDRSWNLNQVYSITMQFNLFNSQTFHICRSQPQKKTYILEQQTDSESTTFLLSQAPNWLAAPPSISVLLAYQPADWRQYFMLDLLNKEKVFQQWHPSKNQIPAKWKSTPLLPFPDSGWLSIGGINQIRTQHGLLESNTTAVSHLQKSAEIKFKERIENHISSLIRLPKLNYQNMLYIETQQKYRYMDEDITEKIGNWLLIHSVNINNNKAYIYTRLESPLSDPTQADKNILLRDALLEQIAYNPTRQPLGILLRTAIASLCVEIHLLESKIDRDYQKYGIPLWKSN